MATYYVDATKTINEINHSVFSPGDFILFQRGCLWREILSPPSSGIAGNNITFGAYGTGDLPKIYGSTLVSGIEIQTRTRCVDNNGNYITIKDLELAYATDLGVLVYTQRGWIVDGCHIHHIGVKNGSLDDGVHCKGADVIIQNCVIHDCGNHGVSLCADSGQNLSNALVQNTIFYDNYHSDIDCQCNGGMFNGAILRYNEHYNTVNFDQAYENGAIYILADKVSPNDIRGVEIYGNTIRNKAGTGIVIRGAVVNPKILNNTINGSLAGFPKYAAGIHVYSNNPGVVDPTAVEIKGNIVSDTHDQCLYVLKPSYVAACDNNCWYQSAGGVATYATVGGISYHYDDFAAYKLATGWDTNGRWGKPSAEYYIDPIQGNDANDGSATYPFKTIAKANAVAIAGDTVFLHGGTYTETIHPANSGTTDAPIVYRARPGETPILTGCYQPIILDKDYAIIEEGITIDGGNRDTSLVDIFALLSGNHNIVRDCPMTNLRTASDWMKGIYVTGTYNRVQGCIISNVGHAIPASSTGIGDGVWVEGHHNLVEGNDISNCGHNTVLLRGHHNIARGNDWHSHWYRTAEMHSPAGTNAHLVMDGNIIRDSSGMTPGPCPAPGVQSDSMGGLFRRNLVIGNVGPGLALWGMVGAGVPKGFRAVHNTLVGNDVGIESNQISENSPGEYSDIVLGNNIIIGNDNPGIRYKPSATDPADHLDVGNFKAGDPLFVDAANGDYRLQPGSPCLNAGVFLTRTRSAGSGTAIPALDASYFIDGFGIVEGDTIQLQGTDEPLTIIAIDYATNTITIDRPASWTPNQGIALGRIDTAPNIGAFAYKENPVAITKTVSFTLGVTAAPDFFPAIAPDSLSVAKGVVAVYNITFTAQGGFTGPVSLIVKNLPAGAVGTFDKPSITVGETSRLSITTSSVAIGSYSPSVEVTANL